MTYRMLIDGELIGGARCFPVVNPATAGIVAEAPDASQSQFELAVVSASRAFPMWSSLKSEERRAYLLTLRDLLRISGEELARLITLEQGKPLTEARREVERAAQLAGFVASLTLPVETYLDDSSISAYCHHKPLGVVAAIPPWNFPMLGALYKIVAAVYVGNTLVLKASPLTPLCVLRLGELMREALPRGVINIVSGGEELGRWMTGHPTIKAISFTGSARVGKAIMSACGETLKRVILELGGNDPAIVLKDVNPKVVAEDLINNAFINSGQVCIAIKRLYVHQDIFAAFVDELVNALRKIRVGNGMEPTTTMGPLQSLAQVARMNDFMRDAASTGAKVLYQSEAPSGSGFFFPATLLTDVPTTAKILNEEAFGPILPVIPFETLDTAISAANSSLCGLGGSVWTNDVQLGTRVAETLECGTAWVNQHRALHPLVPFGGTKESGIGCEMGVQGLLEFTERRIVNIRRRSV